MRNKSSIYLTCCLFLLISGNLFSQSTIMQFRHPLDPLDTNEIKIVKQVLLKENKVRNDSSSLYSIINLLEPPKSEVLAHKPGDDFRREAFAYVYDYPANALGKAILDLKQQKLLSFEKIEGKQPTGAFKADSVASEIVKNNSEWIAALTKRGVNPDSVKASFGNFAADLTQRHGLSCFHFSLPISCPYGM